MRSCASLGSFSFRTWQLHCGKCGAWSDQSSRRGGIEHLTPTEVTAVREANLAFVRDNSITRLETNALQAVATKKSN
jgi:hypothetical protein